MSSIPVVIPSNELEDSLEASRHALAWFQAVKVVASMIEEDDTITEYEETVANGIIETMLEAQKLLKSMLDNGFDITEVIVA